MTLNISILKYASNPAIIRPIKYNSDLIIILAIPLRFDVGLPAFKSAMIDPNKEPNGIDIFPKKKQADKIINTTN